MRYWASIRLFHTNFVLVNLSPPLLCHDVCLHVSILAILHHVLDRVLCFIHLRITLICRFGPQTQFSL